MRITVLFDERSISDYLKTGFGLSLLIGDSVIFDTGPDGDSLLHNIRAFNIDTDKIKTVVLSHEHWDHTDALPKLLSILKTPNVCVCPSFPMKLRRQIVNGGATAVVSHTPNQIADNIFTTGQICGVYKDKPMPEQSLFVMHSNGCIALICGCAHYGIAENIDNIRQNAAEYHNRQLTVDFIVGGFHLSHESDDNLIDITRRLRSSGVQNVAPLHCSGTNGRRIMRSQYGNGFYDLKVGSSFEI